MILFPPLFEDELFYSGMARYHWISGNENPRISMVDMFNSSNVCAATQFPANLISFCRNLPVAHTYSIDELIYGHTYFPYYAPFIPNERVEKLKEIMTNANGTSIYMALGITASGIKRVPVLRYCSECVLEDDEKYGEAYWHRSHQTDGVIVCHKHSKLLKHSEVEINRRHKHEMITLNFYLRHNANMLETEVLRDLDKEIFVSQQSFNLLNMKVKSIGLDQIRQFYVTKLQKKELATESGRIRWLDLLPCFNKYYGEGFLSSLSSNIHSSDEDTWFHKLLRSPRVTCHPLRHILVLGFLGESVDSMMSSFTGGEVNNHQISKNETISKPIPLITAKKATKQRIAWNIRDSDLAGKINMVAVEIANIEPKMIRVTKTEIGRRLRVQALLTRAMNKLPLTQKVINDVIESIEQFQARRITKAVDQLRQKHYHVKVWEVKKVAGLEDKFSAKYEELIAEEIQRQGASSNNHFVDRNQIIKMS